MDVEAISEEQAEAEFSNTSRRAKYTEIIFRVKNNGESLKVSGLTRGQVAALVRRAKEEGIRAKGNYSEGYVVLAP